jgi:hypothetical protein
MPRLPIFAFDESLWTGAIQAPPEVEGKSDAQARSGTVQHPRGIKEAKNLRLAMVDDSGRLYRAEFTAFEKYRIRRPVRLPGRVAFQANDPGPGEIGLAAIGPATSSGRAKFFLIRSLLQIARSWAEEAMKGAGSSF